MQPSDDSDLLRQYAEAHSDAAFARLVERHIHLVYSVALRHTGNPHHAQEVTQAVFIILARKASALQHGRALPSWLFQATRLTAANFMRSEIRRQRRETTAQRESPMNEPSPEAGELWPQIAPLLDAAIAGLNEKDRHVILLRFFEDRPLADLGRALGANEDAARMRVNRALDKLRKYFARRGVSSTSALLAGAMSTHSVQAAPAGLASAVTAIAAAKGAAAGGSTLTLIKGALKIMAWTNMKTAIVVGVGVLLLVGTTTYLIEKNIQANQYTVASNPWSDIGAATPKAALESLAWALTHDKFDRAQELMQWDEKGLAFIGDAKMEQQLTLMSVLRPALKDIESFKILSIRPTRQPDELIVKLLKTFKNRNIVPFAVTAKLRRVGNQWRVVANLEFYQNNTESMLLPFTGSF